MELVSILVYIYGIPYYSCFVPIFSSLVADKPLARVDLPNPRLLPPPEHAQHRQLLLTVHGLRGSSKRNFRGFIVFLLIVIIIINIISFCCNHYYSYYYYYYYHKFFFEQYLSTAAESAKAPL